MPTGLVLPSTRHVWVFPHGRHGHGNPGVILFWLPRPGVDHFDVLAAVQQVPGEVVVDWRRSDLLDPITDPTPANWTAKRRGVRHVWRAPLYDGGPPAPALLLDKRRTDAGAWEVLIATAGGDCGGVHIGWHEPGQIRPVTDDRADRPGPGSEQPAALLYDT